MTNLVLTKQDVETFNADGFLIKRAFFSKEETEKIYQTALDDKVLRDKAYELDDKEGMKTRLTLWYHPGDDIYGKVMRSQRMVNGVTALLGGSPAHYHTKLMQKEPKIGGAWEWHQDYGYWYKEGFIFPHMISVMVALTTANRENGCLQVLKGSHKIERVEHSTVGEQNGISQDLIDAVTKKFELVYVELQPGDTLFFHCNLWHRSDANLSDNSRWSLISAYNLVDNVPYKKYHDSCVTPLNIVPDDELLKAGTKGLGDDAEFLSVDTDQSLK